MKVKSIILLFSVFVLFTVSKSADNYIEFSSIDGKQQFTMKAIDASIYQNTIIDTVLLHRMMLDKNFNKTDFQSILKKAIDSNCFVIKTELIKNHEENEAYVTIFCEFNGRELINFYNFEVLEGHDYWRMKNAYVEIKHEENRSYLYIYASMKEVGFALSTIIRFPYNEDGGYSGTTKYMNIKTKIDITGTEIPTYFSEDE